MEIIFCCDPLYPNRVDSSYENEAEAAQAAGFECATINHETLARGENASLAVRRVATRETPQLAVYRGWMLRPRHYENLYEALRERGVQLINAPQQYLNCHHLPESYSVIESLTPRTIWLPLPDCLDAENVQRALQTFGDSSLILKDYVKSRKHEWNEACFIASASDADEVRRVVARFIELQGDEISGGLVFREYVALQNIGAHSQSGMPLAAEFRLFFLDGGLLQSSRYWTEGDYGESEPPLALFQDVAQRVPSRFFTMDVTQLENGEWIIVELGDGQVAGLPDQNAAPDFYRALKRLASK